MVLHYIKDIEPFVLTVGYPAMFIGSLVEGPALMILVGFFLRLGIFSFAPAFLFLWAGDVVGDFIWYGVGRYGVHRTIVRIGKLFGVSEELIEKIKDKFRKHEGKILFASKLTTGFGFSVFIVMAAWSHGHRIFFRQRISGSTKGSKNIISCRRRRGNCHCSPGIWTLHAQRIFQT
jgi:membrane protein DedA with SNARE-associated domain